MDLRCGRCFGVRKLVVLCHTFGLADATNGRSKLTAFRQKSGRDHVADDQVTRPSWKLRKPEARRVAHSIRLRLGTTGVFSFRSMSCLAACAETDAPSSRDRNAPAALMSAKTAKARMSESGRRSANSLQNVLSQSMPCCCSMMHGPPRQMPRANQPIRALRLRKPEPQRSSHFMCPFSRPKWRKNRWVHEMADPSDFLIIFSTVSAAEIRIASSTRKLSCQSVNSISLFARRS